MGEYQQDRAWEGSYHDQVLAILHPFIPELAALSIASEYRDKKQATDFVVRMKKGCDIAVRLRRSNCGWRDLTIRACRDSGIKTELAKIKEGNGSYYFYGWTDEMHRIVEWILADLDKVRASGLLENRSLYSNGDGTYFIAIPAKDMFSAGCLLHFQCRLLSRQVSLAVSTDCGIQKETRGYNARGMPGRDREMLNAIPGTLQCQDWWDNHPTEREEWMFPEDDYF